MTTIFFREEDFSENRQTSKLENNNIIEEEKNKQKTIMIE